MILIVDGNPTFRRAVAAEAIARGFEAQQAGSVAEAEAMIGRHSVRLALVEALLPDGSGIELVDRVASLGREVPVVLVSRFWWSVGDEATFAADAGITRMVKKPISPVDLLDQVADLLAPPPPEAGADEASRTIELCAALQALRTQYAETLTTEVEDFLGVVALEEAAPRSMLEEARQRAHRIRGTADCIGFHAAAETAAQIETDFTDLIERPGALYSSTRWTVVRQRLERMTDELHPHALVPDPEVRRRVARLLLLETEGRLSRDMVDTGRRAAVEVVTVASVAEAVARASVVWFDGVLVSLDSAEVDPFAFVAALGRFDATARLPLGFIVPQANEIAPALAAVYAGASVILSRDADDRTLASVGLRLAARRRADPPRVLIAEGEANESLRAFANRLAQHGVAHVQATPMASVLGALRAHRPHLLLLDGATRTMSALDVCRLLRATPAWAELPVVMFLAHDSAKARIACFHAGADGCLDPSQTPEELLACTEHRLARAHLSRCLAERDPETGIPTRRAFLDGLRALARRSRRRHEPLALALVAVDGSCTEDATEASSRRVLGALHRLAGTLCRAGDVAGSFAPGVFAVALSGADAIAAQLAVERLHTDALLACGDVGDDTARRCLHAGVAALPADGATLDELLIAAEERLVAARREPGGAIFAGHAPDPETASPSQATTREIPFPADDPSAHDTTDPPPP